MLALQGKGRARTSRERRTNDHAEEEPLIGSHSDREDYNEGSASFQSQLGSFMPFQAAFFPMNSGLTSKPGKEGRKTCFK